MRYYLIILFAFTLFSSCIHNSDNNEHRNAISTEDSIYLSILQKKAQSYAFSLPDSAIFLHNERLTVYKKYYNTLGILMCYNAIEDIYLKVLNDSIGGKMYVDSILKVVHEKGNKQYLYRAYLSLGTYYNYIHEFDSANKNYLASLRAYPSKIDSEYFFEIHGKIADFNADRGNYDAAFKYFQPLVNYANQNPHEIKSIRFYINAYSFANKLNTKDSALAFDYLFRALNSSNKINYSKYNPVIYSNLASYYGKKGKNDSSIFYAQKAIDFMDNNPSAINHYEKPYNNLISGYYFSTQYIKAQNYLEELSSKVNIRDINIGDQIHYYTLSYKVYAHCNLHWKALQSLEKLDSLKDVVHDNEKNKQLNEFNLEFKKLNNDKQLESKNRQISQQKLYTKGFILLSIILVILGVFIYLYLINKRKLDTETKLNDERNRIAQEMHDDLGTTLTTTLMAVEMLKQMPKEQTALNMVSNAADQLYKQINDIIWNLNVNNDNIRNLFSYLIRFTKNFCKETQLIFEFTEKADHYSKIIEGYKRRVVFLIVKELLNNVVKHSSATKIELLLRYEKNIMTIIVIDDGIGFNQSKINHSDRNNGYGMTNIQNNITKLGGVVTWSNVSDKKGTIVEIQLKVK